MRKFMVLLVGVMLAFGLCACSNNASESSTAGEGQGSDGLALETLGDAMAVESTSSGFTFSDTLFCYTFENGNTQAVRVMAEIPSDVHEQIEKLEMNDEWSDKVKELVAPLPLSSVEDLSAGIPAQADLDAYVGKKGSDLMADGYVPSSYTSDADGTYCSMEKGDYACQVTFEETIKEDQEDPAKAVNDLTVKSAQYMGLSGSAADFEEPADE